MSDTEDRIATVREAMLQERTAAGRLEVLLDARRRGEIDDRAARWLANDPSLNATSLTLGALIEQECAAIEESWRRENELLASAAAGGPFWGVGKQADAPVRGLAEFLPERKS